MQFYLNTMNGNLVSHFFFILGLGIKRVCLYIRSPVFGLALGLPVLLVQYISIASRRANDSCSSVLRLRLEAYKAVVS